MQVDTADRQEAGFADKVPDVGMPYLGHDWMVVMDCFGQHTGLEFPTHHLAFVGQAQNVTADSLAHSVNCLTEGVHLYSGKEKNSWHCSLGCKAVDTAPAVVTEDLASPQF